MWLEPTTFWPTVQELNHYGIGLRGWLSLHFSPNMICFCLTSWISKQGLNGLQMVTYRFDHVEISMRQLTNLPFVSAAALGHRNKILRCRDQGEVVVAPQTATTSPSGPAGRASVESSLVGMWFWGGRQFLYYAWHGMFCSTKDTLLCGWRLTVLPQLCKKNMSVDCTVLVSHSQTV